MWGAGEKIDVRTVTEPIWVFLQDRGEGIQAAPASPGNLLDSRALGPHPDLLNQKLEVEAGRQSVSLPGIWVHAGLGTTGFSESCDSADIKSG